MDAETRTVFKEQLDKQLIAEQNSESPDKNALHSKINKLIEDVEKEEKIANEKGKDTDKHVDEPIASA